MAVLFAGAMPYEFVNAPSLSTGNASYFDSTYSPGAFVMNDEEQAMGVNIDEGASSFWVHFYGVIGARTVGSTSEIVAFYDESMQKIGSLTKVSNQGLYLFARDSDNANYGLTVETLVPNASARHYDFHIYYENGNRVVDFYMDANLVGTISAIESALDLRYLRFGGIAEVENENAFSEIIVSSGDDSTMGWRLHTKLPDPGSPGLNTFEQGFWGSLASSSLTEGVVTSVAGSRITGGFHAYTGPATPVGIRGILQSARFIRNDSDLTVSGQLRIAGVNYDVSDNETRSNSRVISFWETNPATGLPWEVADFAGLQGGFRSLVP